MNRTETLFGFGASRWSREWRDKQIKRGNRRWYKVDMSDTGLHSVYYGDADLSLACAVLVDSDRSYTSPATRDR